MGYVDFNAILGMGYWGAGSSVRHCLSHVIDGRWTGAPKDPDDIDIAATPRPPADVSGWADERANLPIDPEFGPGWHLGVLPLDDGGPR